jgi:uncharacterized protein (TIGR00255 family)
MKSMTGYGKCHISRDNIECDIEIKSINGRYLDLKLYMPRELSFFEYPIRKTLPGYISRGTVELRLNLSDLREPQLALNIQKLKKYQDIFGQAREALELSSQVSLEFLLAEPGVIETKNQLAEDDLLQAILRECLIGALKEARSSMEAEAEDIRRVLKDSMTAITPALEAITEYIAPFKQELYESMQKRIADLVGAYKLENMEQRLLQELAMYVDKYDIQEEISRLRSHINTFLECLDTREGDIGKTLNFITQEMQREANTLGSKFSTTNTFKYILIIKEEIEKCREIVQNVA